MVSEDEAKPSLGRACRQIAGRSERTCDLTSAVVPRGTPFHRAVQLEFPPIGFDASRLSCGRSLSGTSEFGAVEPDAVDDHGQPSRQSHDRLLQPTAPGDLHRPGLEPGPFRIAVLSPRTAWGLFSPTEDPAAKML